VKSPGYSLCYLLVGYAIYPPTRHLAVKVRLFIDFLVERFSAGPKAGIGRSNAMDA
jgi:DNA-binding transcriptional LysR family regulator